MLSECVHYIIFTDVFEWECSSVIWDLVGVSHIGKITLAWKTFLSYRVRLIKEAYITHKK